MAVAFGQGNIKKEEFQRFLDSLSGKPVNVNNTINRLKDSGIDVEEN